MKQFLNGSCILWQNRYRSSFNLYHFGCDEIIEMWNRELRPIQYTLNCRWRWYDGTWFMRLVCGMTLLLGALFPRCLWSLSLFLRWWPHHMGRQTVMKRRCRGRGHPWWQWWTCRCTVGLNSTWVRRRRRVESRGLLQVTIWRIFLGRLSRWISNIGCLVVHMFYVLKNGCFCGDWWLVSVGTNEDFKPVLYAFSTVCVGSLCAFTLEISMPVVSIVKLCVSLAVVAV